MACEHCGQEIKDGEQWYYTADECEVHERCYPRAEFIADAERDCPSCEGTGEYNAAGDAGICRACKGTGRVHDAGGAE